MHAIIAAAGAGHRDRSAECTPTSHPYGYILKFSIHRAVPSGTKLNFSMVHSLGPVLRLLCQSFVVYCSRTLRGFDMQNATSVVGTWIGTAVPRKLWRRKGATGLGNFRKVRAMEFPRGTSGSPTVADHVADRLIRKVPREAVEPSRPHELFPSAQCHNVTAAPPITPRAAQQAGRQQGAYSPQKNTYANKFRRLGSSPNLAGL
eukprot:SAG31_NODE_4914_length_2868_cov_1.328040_5_plen_204_part_00